MEEIKIGRIYRHFKGKFYYVKDIAKDSENLEEYVVYSHLYGDYSTWIRPKKIFLEEIDINKEGNVYRQKHRFELIDMEIDEITN